MKLKNLQRIFTLCLLGIPLAALAQDWETEAWERIDTLRKSELNIQVTTESGAPIHNAGVRVQLKRHAFPWGSYMRSHTWNDSPYQDIYKQNILKYFNAAGMSIGLKPREGKGGYWESGAIKATPWFLENNIDMRGAHLVWEGREWMKDEWRAVLDNNDLDDQVKGDSLVKLLETHLYYAIPKWDVQWWDVINEPCVNDVVNKLLPDFNTFTHWFKLADSLRTVHGRDFALGFNENNVISSNASWSSSRMTEYKEHIRKALGEGAPIELIGFQGRIQNGMLSPETMYHRLQQYEEFGLPFQVTEFEIRDNNNFTYTDDQLRQLTEETMVIYFSHHLIEGFFHWTFMDNANGDLPWALFNYDGTPNPTGEKWIELMEGKFNTDTLLSTASSGSCLTRAYKGEYEIEVSYLGERFTQTLSLDEDASAAFTIPLDLYYTMDGLEDSASYALNQDIPIEIEAYSDAGTVTSIGFFVNGDSIAGGTTSGASFNYMPGSDDKGWNEIRVTVRDDQGEVFNHSIDVYFGNRLPVIEILRQPADIIYTNSNGNVVSFKTYDPDGSLSTLKVSLNAEEETFTDTSGVFTFSMDNLPAGNYTYLIEATDAQGGISSSSISFTVMLGENELPTILIVFPYDGTSFPYGNPINLVILASDSDGSIESVDIAINDTQAHSSNESSFTISLDTLSVGPHVITALATDDRGGQDEHEITIAIEDNTSVRENPRNSGPEFYPNPVSDILHFSESCDFVIHGLDGKKLMEKTQCKEVDLSGLKPGIYFILTGDAVHKIIKE